MATMTSNDLIKSPLGKSLITRFDNYKEKYNYAYNSEDMVLIVLNSYFAITKSNSFKMNDKILARLPKYYDSFFDLLKSIIVNDLKINEENFNKWFYTLPTYYNALELYQECGMATPTYKNNKHLIH